MALRHALLGLLARSPGSGWDLQRLFDRSLAHVWPASHSQVYTELNRLAAEQLVSVASEGARGRKEYTLTEAGWSEWLRWMREAPDDQPRRSDMLLRVLFLHLVSERESVEILDRMAAGADVCEVRLSELGKELDADDGPLTRNGLLALEYGVRLARMQQEWAVWARAQLARRGADED